MHQALDLVVISRDESALRPKVVAGIEANQTALARSGISITLHRVFGRRLQRDANRWETIVRARNVARRVGNASWLMYLDDDVQLTSDCVLQLLRGLAARPDHAALAADYLGEARENGTNPHVGMGATLFRRSVLVRTEFRWEDDRCECQCYCDDLRRRGWAISYLAQARAQHLRPYMACHSKYCHPGNAGSAPEGRVLAAFDYRHLRKFRERFLASLRNAGNREIVTAVCFGLSAAQRRELGREPAVEIWSRPDNGVAAPVRRLVEFPAVIDRWPRETPVAYWDAGDVFFQGRLAPLWRIASEHPTKLLAVSEPFTYPENGVIEYWTLSIHDAAARQLAFDLARQKPFLNSGFGAGTVAALLPYFKEADYLKHSRALEGSTDWGDQMAMNLYCHTQPERWLEVEQGWNYCLAGRKPREVKVTADGYYASRFSTPIYAVHGNAGSLRAKSLLRHVGHA